ncbi:hypothetical protein JF544_02915 [Halobacillus kuroshimensis]|uniref:YitT family protein n=1 Tax=Halobacillus kuroshimensis TaxID=302481 RepID=A0ABS3DS60_9BACI|nr:hypothetical protein [Halobacillus kuroshimensis]MBN8234177.1 hypothetical protein [Halobacillus kuroshimensis]
MKWNRLVYYIMGIFTVYFGTALVVKASLGAGFWTALFVGFSERFGMSAGFWFGITQVVVIFVNARLKKTHPDIFAFIPILLESVILDFWLLVVMGAWDFSMLPLWVKMLTFTGGLLAATFGISLYIQTGFPRAPADDLFVSISERFQMRLGSAQVVVAVMAAVLAYGVGGPVGMGAILSVLLAGPCIELWSTKTAVLLSS